MTREEKIALLLKKRAGTLTREDKIALIREKRANKAAEKKPFLKREMPLIGGEIGEDYIRPLMQAGGLVGGGIAGLPAGPVGAVAGGGLGYAGAEEGYRILKGLTGDRDDKTVPEALTDAGGNVMKGAMMEMGGKMMPTAIKGGLQQVPKAAQAYAKTFMNVPTKASKIIGERPGAVKEYVGLSEYEAGKKLIADINAAKSKRLAPAQAGLNNELSLATIQGKKVDMRPVIKAMRDKVEKLPVPKTSTALKERAETLRYIETLEKSAKSKMTPVEANEFKRQIQKDAFKTDPNTGIAYKRTDELAGVVKDGAHGAKVAVEKAVPGVKQYNKEIQRVITATENKKLSTAFKPENIEATVKNIQSETGNKGYLQEQLNRMDALLGTDAKRATENIFASKFLKPSGEGLSMLPTGRSGFAGGLGAMLGGAPGAAGGVIATSPMTYRAVAPRAGAIYSGMESLATNPITQAAAQASPLMFGREGGWKDDLMKYYGGE